MANETNMYYRFTSDNEPSEEQLAVIMQEVREEVREKKSKNTVHDNGKYFA